MLKKPIVGIGIILLVLFGGYFGVNAFLATSDDIPVMTVNSGEFLISLNVNGAVDARQAYVISCPRIRGLQITWLAPEGSMVEAGDPVLKFDATKQMADLQDNESSLKIAQTTHGRSKQEYTIQDKKLQLELQQARRNYDEKKYDAPRLAEEAKLELELAELNFGAKLDQIRSDVVKAELEVKRAQDKVNIAKREFSQLTITAPIPGMVVYLEIWKGGTVSKVQEGDSPWPGQGLINLPDLSEMIVKATASEVDASAIDSGQEVIVRLDAFPDVNYSGVVYKKGTLAHRKEPGSRINVFDVDIAILDKDESLKPGMSASGRIIIERIENVVSVPLEAVFVKDGRPVVYMHNRKSREVSVGRRNDMSIEILSGLDGGERICLINPTLEEQGLPGDKATEPELNKGRDRKKMGQGRGKRGNGRSRKKG